MSAKSLSIAVYVATLFLVRPDLSFAQETANTASISGRVTDPSGAVIAGAHVVARQTETNISRAADTDGAGRFRLPYLKLGAYEVTISRNSFATVTRQVTLYLDTAADLQIQLPLGTLASTVDVATTVSRVEPVTHLAGLISQREIQDLPMNGRNFLDLALLAPGVSVPNNGGGTQLFAETSAVTGVGLSFSSQRNFSNNFVVDGLSANDDAAGLSGIALGVDAVDQFQMVTTSAQAQFGRALGGYVNIATRSGTNVLHGDAYGYVRDQRLNSPNALLGATLPMNQQQMGGSLGGPVGKTHTFYFMNGEYRRLNQSGLVTIPDANVSAINARLAAVGYPGSLIGTGVYPNPVRTSTFMAKIEHQFDGGDRLSVRYNAYDASASNSRGAGALTAATASAGLENLDQTIAIGHTTVLSPRIVNEARGQFALSHLSAPPSDAVGPAVSISGVAVFGTLSSSPTARRNTMAEFVDDFLVYAGAHSVTTGVSFLYNDDTITFPRSIRGSYAFSSLSNFLSGTYGNGGFTQTFGTAAVEQTNPNAGFYVQDRWNAAKRLSIDVGVRYDLQFLQTIRTDTNNVSPRAGFSWTPFGSDRTIVRGNAGFFYDRVPLRALANALLSAGNTANIANLRQISVSLSPSQTGAPVFPNVLGASIAPTTLLNLTTMDPRMQNASSRQASVEIEHRFGEVTSVTAGYQYLRGRGLLAQINQNVPACVATGTNNGCRPITTYANNNQYSAAGSSTYHGLHVSIVRRTGSWGTYRASYTLSKSMDDVGENFFSAPIDPTDISKDWARSDDDQRHRFVFSGSIASPSTAPTGLWQRLSRGFQFTGIVQAYSALPLNITSGVTTIQGTAGRPIVNGAFIGRNAGTGPSFLNVNLRLVRSFASGTRTHVDVMVEAFNLTNHTNPLALNGVFGAGSYPLSPSSTFGQVTAVADARSVQLGIKVRF